MFLSSVHQRMQDKCASAHFRWILKRARVKSKIYVEFGVVAKISHHNVKHCKAKSAPSDEKQCGLEVDKQPMTRDSHQHVVCPVRQSSEALRLRGASTRQAGHRVGPKDQGMVSRGCGLSWIRPSIHTTAAVICRRCPVFSLFGSIREEVVKDAESVRNQQQQHLQQHSCTLDECLQLYTKEEQVGKTQPGCFTCVRQTVPPPPAQTAALGLIRKGKATMCR